NSLDHDLLLLYALHAAETYLRTRPRAALDGLSWPAVRGAVLLHLAKLATQPFGNAGASGSPAPLPKAPGYSTRVAFLPYDRIGRCWFGGDWYAGLQSADGALWVLVADVTGHGYHAYLLASALPGVWQACWQSAAPREPAELLAAMHDHLHDCLPEGVYVE